MRVPSAGDGRESALRSEGRDDGTGAAVVEEEAVDEAADANAREAEDGPEEQHAEAAGISDLLRMLRMLRPRSRSGDWMRRAAMLVEIASREPEDKRQAGACAGPIPKRAASIRGCGPLRYLCDCAGPKELRQGIRGFVGVREERGMPPRMMLDDWIFLPNAKLSKRRSILTCESSFWLPSRLLLVLEALPIRVRSGKSRLAPREISYGKKRRRESAAKNARKPSWRREKIAEPRATRSSPVFLDRSSKGTHQPACQPASQKSDCEAACSRLLKPATELELLLHPNRLAQPHSSTLIHRHSRPFCTKTSRVTCAHHHPRTRAPNHTTHRLAFRIRLIIHTSWPLLRRLPPASLRAASP